MLADVGPVYQVSRAVLSPPALSVPLDLNPGYMLKQAPNPPRPPAGYRRRVCSGLVRVSRVPGLLVSHFRLLVARSATGCQPFSWQMRCGARGLSGHLTQAPTLHFLYVLLQIRAWFLNLYLYFLIANKMEWSLSTI